MCAYQEPEVYVKQFVGRVLSGIESVQFFFEEVRVPHIRLKADNGVENIEFISPKRATKKLYRKSHGI